MRALAVLLLLSLLASPAAAQDSFPIESIDAKHRPAVKRIRKDATVRTGAITRDVRCRSSIYRHLLTQLPQASRWLRALGMGDYTIADLPDGRFSIDDKAGATATCVRALDGADTLVVVARGKLDVAVLPTLGGSGVIHITWKPKPDDPKLLACVARVEFRLDSGLLHALSRPFKRTLNRVLREKMAALVKSATELGEAIQKSPHTVYRRLKRAKAADSDLRAFREAFLSL